VTYQFTDKNNILYQKNLAKVCHEMVPSEDNKVLKDYTVLEQNYYRWKMTK